MSAPQEIRDWWAENPMTYGSRHGSAEYDAGAFTPGTREFFDQIDSRLYEWNSPLHDKAPFDRLFPYAEVGRGGAVLEVGCGLGSMAMNWALQGARVTAVDLNPVAVQQTRARFELHGLEGDILEADARELPFDDGAFDYVWSWGVLHHSPELERSLTEAMRVLRSGGRFGFMLYHRRSLLHWYLTEYVEGVLHMERRFLSPLERASRYGDAAREEGNPHTWPVTRAEARDLLSAHAVELGIRVLGTDLDGVLDSIVPELRRAVPTWAKKPLARRFGWSLWIEGVRA